VSAVTKARARVAILTRHRETDDPDLGKAKADLHEARLLEAIQREVAAAPPLTMEQRAKLAAILLTAPSGGAA
jgi:hypothetical protein